MPEYAEYPLMNNLKADIRNIGMEPQLIPLVDHIASQRINMFTTAITQAMIPDGREMPSVASGKERDFMNYTFNSGRFTQNAVTLAVIPIYRVGVGSDPIPYCPAYVLVYLGEEDNLVHSMYVSTYVQGTNGFGYDQELDIAPGVFVPKGSCVAHAKTVVGSRYCLGVNLNVCYGTFKETVEDAFAISRSAAKKLTTTGYKTLVINVQKNMIPVNLYGDIGHFKFLPELGEKVREDGVVCAFRQVDDLSYISDMTAEALSGAFYLHDDVYYAQHPDATLVDIRVVRNPSNKVKTPSYVFAQTEKYERETIDFHRRIIQVYEQECLKKSRGIGKEFNVLVTKAAETLGTIPKQRAFGKVRRSPSKYTRKNDVIGFMELILTLRYKMPISLASKITGRSGDKGVISAIIEDRDMPVDDYGNRADIIMAPETIVNRMNLSQLYETFINYVSGFIIRRMKTMTVDAAYEYLLGYMEDINPEYAKLIRTQVIKTQGDREMLVKNTLDNDQIILVVPPFLNTINEEWVLCMKEKYGIEPTPIEYNLRDKNTGKLIRRVRTERSFYIGKKYVYVLCKIPYCTSSGIGYVNQWGVPIAVRDQNNKNLYPIALTTIREGEDENRNLMLSLSPRLAFRVLSLYANSPQSTQKAADTLLSEEYPTRIDWFDITDADLRKNNQIIKGFQSMMTTCGIDVRNPIATAEEIERFANN